MSNKSSYEKNGSVSMGYLTKEGFHNIRSNKLMSIASVAVLMSCLVLIGVAYMLFVNINKVISDISQQNVIMVFITDDSTDEQIAQMGEKIESIPNVAKSRFISKEEAFPEVLDSIGSAAALFDGMEDNPLPDAYEITLEDMALYDDTVSELSMLDNVLSLRQNRDFAKRLTDLRKTVSYISIGVIVMLLVVSLFIISNTVRVTMYNRRLEITIMKSVGATKWFIRWPFMIEGIVLGIISGLVSLGVVWGLYEASAKTIMDFLNVLSAKPADFMDYLPIMLTAFVAVGVVTGAFGSILSMNKYLKEQDYDSENVSN